MPECTLDILVLTPWFPNRRGGWPAPFIADSCIALAQAGHNLRLFAFRAFEPRLAKRFVPLEHRGKIVTADFPEFQSLELRRHFALPGGLLRPITNWSLDKSISHAITQISERKPDIVLIHTEGLAPAAVPMAQTLDIPSVVILHGENTNQDYLFSPRQAQRFRKAISSASKTVIVGEPLRQHALRLGAAEDRIEVIWNGVNAPRTTRIIPEPDNQRLRIITTSNLLRAKGVDILINALARMRNEGLDSWHLTVIGEGPMRAELIRQTEAGGLRDLVDFLGAMPNSDVFAHLAKSDVFVLPSYREAFGVAYLEAMASGLLTIGVEDQGPAQFIKHGQTGFLCKPRSVTSLSEILKPLIEKSGRGEWRKIAAQGAVFVRSEMSWGAHAKRMAALMQDLAMKN